MDESVSEHIETPAPKPPARWPQFLLNLLILPFFIAVNAVLFSILIVQLLYLSHVRTSVAAVDERPTAIVLGASVKRDGTPSPALLDRIQGGVDLYNAGKVDRILMTGDDGLFHIDEISVMKRAAMEAGVPEQDILTDGHGYRTYESCKRAIEIFSINRAVVVTQRFHLGRVLFLCNELGIDAVGLTADRQSYDRHYEFWFRDLLSSVKAFSDIYIFPPKPPVEYVN